MWEAGLQLILIKLEQLIQTIPQKEIKAQKGLAYT